MSTNASREAWMHGVAIRRWIAFAILVLPELEVPLSIITLALMFYSFV
jgi:hypothetical protein